MVRTGFFRLSSFDVVGRLLVALRMLGLEISGPMVIRGSIVARR